MGEYCGNSIPPNHVSSSNKVLIKFISDGSNMYLCTSETNNPNCNYGGFKMEYNPTGKQNTSIQNNTEHYEDYYSELWEYSSFLDDFFSYRINQNSH